jgi:hypothetical protein
MYASLSLSPLVTVRTCAAKGNVRSDWFEIQISNNYFQNIWKSLWRESSVFYFAPNSRIWFKLRSKFRVRTTPTKSGFLGPNLANRLQYVILYLHDKLTWHIKVVVTRWWYNAALQQSTNNFIFNSLMVYAQTISGSDRGTLRVPRAPSALQQSPNNFILNPFGICTNHQRLRPRHASRAESAFGAATES